MPHKQLTVPCNADGLICPSCEDQVRVDGKSCPHCNRNGNAKPDPGRSSRLCGNGCGKVARFYSATLRKKRCAENAWECPSVKSRLVEHIQTHVHIFTAEDHTKSSERGKALYKGEGNPMFGVIRSEATRSKISKERMARGVAQGSRNPNWRGGIAVLNSTARQRDMATGRYQQWRTAVFKRDNYTCQECGDKNGNGKRVVLNADHIKSYAGFPELRYDVDNGRTLCRPCHEATFKETQQQLRDLRHGIKQA